MRKISVSVFIPAYNEEDNINPLLESLLVQKHDGFIIDKIIVFSDQSTDLTDKMVKKNNDKRIRLIRNKKRIGKVAIMNIAFGTFSPDVLVQLDSDIKLKDKFVLQNLIEPFKINRSTDLVLGKQLPLTPNSLVEKVVYFGFQIWEKARTDLGDKAERDYCTGMIRGFSKKLYTTLRFPLDVGSSEDSYGYYYAKTNNYNVAVAKDAIVYFRLPTTIKDYTIQTARFVEHSQTIKRYFGEKVMLKYENINYKTKFKAFLKISRKKPIYISILYVLFQFLPKITAKFYKQKPVWNPTYSSKLLYRKKS